MSRKPETPDRITTLYYIMISLEVLLDVTEKVTTFIPMPVA